VPSFVLRILRSQAGRQVYTLNTDLLLKLEFPSNPELLCVVRGTMERLTERMGFAERECRSVTRAVDEAVTNIIRHAYRGQPNQPIVLTCYRLPKAVGSELAQGLEIVLEDQGEPPDPDRLRGRSRDELHPRKYGCGGIQQLWRKESASISQMPAARKYDSGLVMEARSCRSPLGESTRLPSWN